MVTQDKTKTSHPSDLDAVYYFTDAMSDSREFLIKGSEKFNDAAKLDFSEKINNVTFIEVMNLLLGALDNVSDEDKDLTILDLIIKYEQVITAILNLPEHERNLCVLEIQKSKPQIFAFLQKKSADVLKLITNAVADKEEANGEASYKQIGQNVSENVDGLIHKRRKNKYGLEMTDLEQELDDIKLGFREIEKFDSRGNKKEDSYSFFMRVYGKYRQANVIYQADLLTIDKQLLKSLTNFFHRGRYSEGQISTLQDFLPSRSERTNRLIERIEKDKLTNQDISPVASTLLDKHTTIHRKSYIRSH